MILQANCKNWFKLKIAKLSRWARVNTEQNWEMFLLYFKIKKIQKKFWKNLSTKDILEEK